MPRFHGTWARIMATGAISLVLLAGAPGPVWAHGRGGVFIGFGPLWWPPYPYWYYPPPSYVYPPPPIVVQEPPVYIQQAPPLPEPPAGPYWYYCPSARQYYPTVSTCPEAWVKVPPRPE